MDSIYIRQVLSGNIDAFKYFVEAYKDFAFSLSYSILKNNYLAEESVQESFIKSYDKLSTFKHNATFKTWFGRIVINESLRRIKQTDTSPGINDISDMEISDVECSMNKLLNEERRFYIDKVFESLTHEKLFIPSAEAFFPHQGLKIMTHENQSLFDNLYLQTMNKQNAKL